MKTVIYRCKKIVFRNSRRLTSLYAYRNYRLWKSLKGKYKGQTIVLIGNGPSLNKTPLYLLEKHNTIVFNRFDLMLERLNWNPTFYMVNDGLVGKDIQNEIKALIPKTKKSFFPDISKGDNVNFREFLGDVDNLVYFFEEPVRFSNILPWVGTGNTVIYVAFQVLKYLGFSKIYFCGVDLNYVIDKKANLLKEENIKGRSIQSIKSTCDDDPNHFDPRYFGEGRLYHQPTQTIVDNIFTNMKWVRDNFEKSSSEVINIGYDSMVDYFPKQDFFQALNITKEKEQFLFESLVKSKGFDSLIDFLDKAQICNNEMEWSDTSLIAMPEDEAVKIIKKKILKYVPLGPFQKTIYFIKRN